MDEIIKLETMQYFIRVPGGKKAVIGHMIQFDSFRLMYCIDDDKEHIISCPLTGTVLSRTTCNSHAEKALHNNQILCGYRKYLSSAAIRKSMYEFRSLKIV